MRKFLVLIITVFLLMQMTAYAAHPFTDVSEEQWYHNAVDYVYNNGLMSGTETEQFSPYVNMNRAMLVTVLYRLAGSPDFSSYNPFNDVEPSAYYYRPVVWAFSNGIVAGTSATTFAPENDITREQMVAIFAKYAIYEGLKASDDTGNLSDYCDVSNISEYALEAFGWAVSAGIISGTSATTLEPQGVATRAQCAVIMCKFDQWADEQKNAEITPTPLPPLEDEESGAGWA